jgi:hypothetical protein
MSTPHTPLPTVKIAVGRKGATARQATMVTKPALWSEGGLAVTRAVGRKGWAITHLRSGYAVVPPIRLSRDAITVARRLLDAGDWTRYRTIVLADRHLRDRALQIRDEARLLGLLS